MQTFEGYFVEKSKFVPLCGASMPVHKRAIVTVLDEPLTNPAEEGIAEIYDNVKDDTLAGDIAAMEEFIKAIKASDELIPDFQRVSFDREVTL
jgi:hypothetical protein